jgi:hypothetical protein
MARSCLLGPLALGAVAPAPASAGFYSGDDLLKVCTADRKSPDYLDNSYQCAAYVAGAVDAFNTTRAALGLKSCLPADVTIKRLKDVTVGYLNAHPEETTRSASTLVFAATRKAWPCKSANTRRKRR